MKISVDDIALSVVCLHAVDRRFLTRRRSHQKYFFKKWHIPLDNYDDFSGFMCPDLIAQLTGKTIVNSWQKFVATDVMLGIYLIYSLIWTICHKLMWFYRNTVLFHIIFVVTHGDIFGHLGHTGPLTVKTKWRCRRCIGGDCVIFLLLLKEIRLQLSHKASQQVLL